MSPLCTKAFPVAYVSPYPYWAESQNLFTTAFALPELGRRLLLDMLLEARGVLVAFVDKAETRRAIYYSES